MSKVFVNLIATAMACTAALSLATPVVAETPGEAQKLTTGLPPIVQLLQLMDTDQNGKVSKEEFMHFMEAEFDFADKNHDGQLDPIELRAFVYRLTHPSRLPAVRK